MGVAIEFCGTRTAVPDDRPFVIGRLADLDIDDNPFLHRHFLALTCSGGVWLLSNVGAQLSATVSDADGRLEAFLAPGGVLPIVFPRTVVRFTAGGTSYALEVLVSEPAFDSPHVAQSSSGQTTAGRFALTPSQLRLVLAFAEPMLLRSTESSIAVPSLTDAARRLGWGQTKLNRKLDNVCQKLTRLGVRGLHGGPDRLASNRRARLVEYVVATRLVTRDDLILLDQPDDEPPDA